MKTLLALIVIIILVVIVTSNIFIWSWNRKWRKKIQVGDKCYFKNSLGGKTYGKIEDIDGDMAAVRSKIGHSEGYGWHEIKALKVI